MSLDSVTEYALSFKGDAVSLQSRDKVSSDALDGHSDWQELGMVDFEDPAFRDRLIELRQTISDGDAETPVPVTLIIPDDQILYTTLTVAASVDREHAVGRALDGLTPYAIQDLAFDWEGDGDSVRVAAVARQTLREAREFAAQYGFAGQGYCADPAADHFPGAPVFVLDRPARPRPVVDPAQAGVTAAALMIEPEAQPEVDLELPGEMPALSDDKADIPLDAMVAAAAAQASQPAPVVRHPPPVKGPTAASRSEEMNPRARAVHERAAEARQARQAGAAPAAAPRPAPGYRGGLTGLVAMLGALVVGLVLIWAFVVPDGKPAQVVANSAATTPATPPAESQPTETPTDVAPVVEAPVDTDPAPVETAAAPIDPPAQEPAAAAPVAAADPAPVALQPAFAPPISALTEAEARRVVVAAAAVAAAVVPPTSGDTRATVAAVTSQVVPDAVPARPATPTPTPTSTPAATQPAVPETPARRAPTPAAAPATRPAATAVARPASTAPTRQAAAPAAQRLTSSARPQLAPRRSTPQTSVPRADTTPSVPANPISYEASRQTVQPTRSNRPPSRNRAAVAAPAPQAAAPEAAPVATQAQSTVRGSARPPQRPEGSAPDAVMDDGAALAPEERQQLGALLRDMNRYGLALPKQGGVPTPRPDAQLAQARPQPKPAHAATASDAVSPSAVQAALRSASTTPADRPAGNDAAATPARNSGGLLRNSARPTSRPSGGGGVSEQAVETAVASAVQATPGAVQLTALRSSPTPPRKPDAPAAAAARPESAPDAPATAATAAAAAPAAGDAEAAARRALDEQLQAQAEARIRARAQADAAAEAQARAQAEARARAQAAAEERQARARQQVYKPPEVDDEPELAAAATRGGVTAANVAQSATQSRGMNTSRTTIIGIIGAGDASRALIRLRNGKIVTVRMGDRIDGGTINSIGEGRLTYVKSGQVRELRMLDGR